MFQDDYLKVRNILEASYSTVQYTGGLGTAMIPKVDKITIVSRIFSICHVDLMDLLITSNLN